MNNLIISDIIVGQPAILQNHLVKCIDFILHEICDVKAILLSGGYGRAEGSWLMEQENFRPYNDYDFTVIVKDNTSKSLKNIITDDLASEIGINWIDIDVYTEEMLRCLRPTIKNYDIINGSTIIYGDQNILNITPTINVKNFTNKEIYTLYFTRAYTMLFSTPFDAKIINLSDDKMVFLRNQLAKGFLAVQDCQLLTEYNYYNSSYKKRFSYFSSVSDDCNKKKWFEWALNEKMEPRVKTDSVEFVQSAHYALFNFYINDMNKYLGCYFHNFSLSPKNIKKIHYTKFEMIGKYLLSKYSKKFEQFEKQIYLNIIQYILIHTYPGYSKSGFFDEQVEYLSRLVRKIDDDYDLPITWQNTRQLVKENR